MTFKEIQDAVITDRFDETKRAQIKNWINSRYGRVWAIDPWSFKTVSVEYTLPASSGSVTLAELGLQRIHAVYKSQGVGWTGIYADRPEDFNTGETSASRKAIAFTVVNNAVVFDASYASAQDLVFVGETKWTSLVDDDDVPLLPEEFHWMLVHGATSEGLRIENDPSWQAAEQDWAANLTDLRLAYSSSVMSYGDAAPAFVPYIGW